MSYEQQEDAANAGGELAQKSYAVAASSPAVAALARQEAAVDAAQ
jgi:hypothetical protein